MMTPTEYIDFLHKSAIDEGPHFRIKEKLERLDPILKNAYMEGFNDGLTTFKYIIKADINLDIIQMSVSI
jgi:hypothetical protein